MKHFLAYHQRYWKDVNLTFASGARIIASAAKIGQSLQRVRTLTRSHGELLMPPKIEELKEGATMALKTKSVRLLVQDVLNTFSKPYGEDVIEDVFVEIQDKSEWRSRYDELVDELTQPVVNSWIGWHTKSVTGYDTLREVGVQRTKLIKTYSKLVPA
jgi:lambda repressor-like predicted transcriptional regulator